MINLKYIKTDILDFIDNSKLDDKELFEITNITIDKIKLGNTSDEIEEYIKDKNY